MFQHTTKERVDRLPNLLDALVELNKLNASPGEKCHMLASTIEFVKKLIREELKKDPAP